MAGNREHLLDDNQLDRSDVVANAAMNRERGLMGVNSYAKDLAFDPIGFLLARLEKQSRVAWLDLCCGTGKALVEAAQAFQHQHLADRVDLLGVDLVPMFYPVDPGWALLELRQASLSSWQPDRPFDLITCVHGLHYLGDKLGLLQRAASWLKEDGLFLGNLDVSNIRLAGLPDAAPLVRRALRRNGFEYDTRRRLIVCRGNKQITWRYRYLGADDAAGPNYTKQPVVNSHYKAPSDDAD